MFGFYEEVERGSVVLEGLVFGGGLGGVFVCGQKTEVGGKDGWGGGEACKSGRVGRGGREKVAVVLSRRGGGESWRESGRAWEWV